jgi:hypothetical protein
MQDSPVGGIRRHFNYSNVMSTLAVFLVVAGGTAVAAKIEGTKIEPGTLKNKALKADTVKSNKLKNGQAVANEDVIPGTLTGASLANNAITTPKIADGAITTPKIADDAVTGAKANEATFGEVPTAGTASTVAYAMLESTGSLSDPDRTKGIVQANITHIGGTGEYCFEGLGFQPKNAMVSGDSGFGFVDTLASVRIATPTGSALGGCPAAATVRVRTFDISAAALADRAFLVAFQS